MTDDTTVFATETLRTGRIGNLRGLLASVVEPLSFTT
jgi:hypothetical protein